MDGSRVNEAEMRLQDSIELSRLQGARASELRAAIDLAKLRAMQDRLAEARAVLQACVAGFADGFGTADMRAAEHLLATLG